MNSPSKSIPPLIDKIWAVVTARGDVLGEHLTYHAAFLLAKDSEHTFVVGQQSVDRARQTNQTKENDTNANT